MASTQRAASGSDGRLRLVLGLLVALFVVAAGLVGLQVTVGGVPVLDRLVPASTPGLTVVDAAPPALDCGTGDADGGVVAGAGVRSDLASAAQAERAASPVGETLVEVTGYRRGGNRVDVVWVDGTARARLVLTYVASGGGWVLTGRSGCAV